MNKNPSGANISRSNEVTGSPHRAFPIFPTWRVDYTPERRTFPTAS
jgi:hypothetical protein